MCERRVAALAPPLPTAKSQEVCAVGAVNLKCHGRHERACGTSMRTAATANATRRPAIRHTSPRCWPRRSAGSRLMTPPGGAGSRRRASRRFRSPMNSSLSIQPRSWRRCSPSSASTPRSPRASGHELQSLPTPNRRTGFRASAPLAMPMAEEASGRRRPLRYKVIFISRCPPGLPCV